jgi:hypothetical protein
MRLIDADELKIQFDGHFVGVSKNDIDNAPTVDAKPIIHGCWNEKECGLLYECSQCKHLVEIPQPYCSNCGANMQSE